MIPILYEKTEAVFVSNGLGRLRDIISATVTEERNGIYELDFEYPVTGAHFDEIQLGRIVGVTHDDTGDVQPFDIASYEKPTDGVVTFHCVHISYRQSYLTVTSSNINTLANAFTALGNSTPSNPFTYETDKASTGYVGAFDGIPKTVRSVLGGIEGSILDAYGGEYEWDKFRVILHSERGQMRSFSIRYGVNMLDYNEEVDTQGTYSSCIPYWTDGTTKIVGNKQTSGGSTISGRDDCVPLDVSDRFESKPTKAQVEAMAQSVMNANTPYLPVQNIHVEFVRLQDMPEYQGFGNLLRCNLCDTIQVIFPDYNSSGWFKIVKTVWNVLRDRYDSMELGDLSITLSEALGIDNSGESSGLKAWQAEVDNTLSTLTTAIDKLKVLGEVTTFSTAANTTKNIALENGARRLIFGAGASTSKSMAIISATSSGTSSYRWVHQGSTDITLTNGTNTIALKNNTGNAMRWIMIDFAQ